MPSLLAGPILSHATGLLLLLAATGCGSLKDSGQQAPPEIVSRRSSTPWIKEFLASHQKELSKTINPHRLQAWATKTCRALQPAELHRSIKAEEIPKDVLADNFRNRAIGITAVSDVTNGRRHVILLEGGSGMMGWYGLEVGDKEYRPAEPDAYYLEWIPGCYLFLSPP